MDIKETKEFAELKNNFQAILGKQEADLLIKNVKIVDVYSERVKEGSVLINNGIIIALNPPEYIQVKEVFDGKGMYAAPGLIDSHCHIDSHLVTPAAFAEAIVPFGTTTAICEIEDVVGAAKREGVKATEMLFSELEKLPYHIYLQAPGKKVDFDICKEILDMDISIAQGEFAELDFLEGKEEVLEQIAYAKSKGKLIHSHVKYPERGNPYPINLFAMVGTANDHNPFVYEHLEADLSLGIEAMIREGVRGGLSCMDLTIPQLLNNHLPTDSLLFCTDDIPIDEIFERGHLNYNVNRAIGFGMSPITAIRIATLNAARSFRIDDKVGSITPGRFADLVFLNNLQQIDPVLVMHKGKVVAENGRLLAQPQIDYSAGIKELPQGLGNLSKEDFELMPIEISEDGTKAKVVCIYMAMPSRVVEDWFDYKDGKVIPPPNANRLAIIQRYQDENGERKIINGFVTGYELKDGALAAYYASVKPQICVVGINADDMYAAAKAMDAYPGGFLAVKNEEVQAVLPLEIYSTISTMSAREAYQRVQELEAAGSELGCNAIMPWFFRVNIMHWMLDRVRLID